MKIPPIEQTLKLLCHEGISAYAWTIRHFELTPNCPIELWVSVSLGHEQVSMTSEVCRRLGTLNRHEVGSVAHWWDKIMQCRDARPDTYELWYPKTTVEWRAPLLSQNCKTWPLVDFDQRTIFEGAIMLGVRLGIESAVSSLGIGQRNSETLDRFWLDSENYVELFFAFRGDDDMRARWISGFNAFAESLAHMASQLSPTERRSRASRLRSTLNRHSLLAMLHSEIREGTSNSYLKLLNADYQSDLEDR